MKYLQMSLKAFYFVAYLCLISIKRITFLCQICCKERSLRIKIWNIKKGKNLELWWYSSANELISIDSVFGLWHIHPHSNSLTAGRLYWGITWNQRFSYWKGRIGIFLLLIEYHESSQSHTILCFIYVKVNNSENKFMSQ